MVHRISNETVADHEIVHEFNHKMSAGNHYVSGHYLGRQYETKNGQFFKESKKVVYYFKESVCTPLWLVNRKVENCLSVMR